MGSRKTAEFSDTVVNHSVNVNALKECEGNINLKWTYLAPKNCSLGPVCPLVGRVYEGLTLWLFNSSPWYRWPIEIDDCPIKTSIYKGFSMAMLNNQMVTIEFMGFTNVSRLASPCTSLAPSGWLTQSTGNALRLWSPRNWRFASRSTKKHGKPWW